LAPNSTTDSNPQKQLSLQPFATPSAVKSLFDNMVQHLKSQIPFILSKIRLYLESHRNAILLFTPIKTNVLDALDNFFTLITKEYKADEVSGIQPSIVTEIEHLLQESFRVGYVRL
jgi:hypothetical protein